MLDIFFGYILKIPINPLLHQYYPPKWPEKLEAQIPPQLASKDKCTLSSPVTWWKSGITILGRENRSETSNDT